MPRKNYQRENEKEREKVVEEADDSTELQDDVDEYIWEGEPSRVDRGYEYYANLSVVTKEYGKHKFSIGDGAITFYSIFRFFPHRFNRIIIIIFL
jgi:hypothetical protein